MAKDNGKTVIKVPPCKVPNPCLGYDDYDPCVSSDDITEKDLAVLLKEEQAKLQREKERAEAELRKLQGEGAGQSSGDDKEEQGARDGADGGGADGKKLCHRKKRLCRKISTNPFFTNRLGFSNDLPPPPPFPPPQFLPPVEESDSNLKICRKRKRRCKKKKIEEAEESKHSLKPKEKEKEREEEREEEEEEKEKEIICDCMDEKDEEKYEESDTEKREKRRCKRPVRNAFPCRKKVSEVSISLQPRHIPALQRDLPPTSPKDLPEVVRQILMACGKDCDVDCSKKKPKKKCEKVK